MRKTLKIDCLKCHHTMEGGRRPAESCARIAIRQRQREKTPSFEGTPFTRIARAVTMKRRRPKKHLPVQPGVLSACEGEVD